MRKRKDEIDRKKNLLTRLFISTKFKIKSYEIFFLTWSNWFGQSKNNLDDDY
jgi:hypothetical protein